MKHDTPSVPAGDLVSYDRWLEELGISAPTGWRWRKSNLIRTVNINGRVYIRRSEIADFERRAQAGDFAKTRKTPTSTRHLRPKIGESTATEECAV